MRRRTRYLNKKPNTSKNSAIERISLTAIALSFISVFAFTYTNVDTQRSDKDVFQNKELNKKDTILPDRLDTPSQKVDNLKKEKFTICHTGGGSNCIVDGDTAWIDGVKVRVADIDAPETHPPRCNEEALLGAQATKRLAELMNMGPFELIVQGASQDRYGRQLRVLMRDGHSLGMQLVNEGLAREWKGARQPWC